MNEKAGVSKQLNARHKKVISPLHRLIVLVAPTRLADSGFCGWGVCVTDDLASPIIFCCIYPLSLGVKLKCAVYMISVILFYVEAIIQYVRLSAAQLVLTWSVADWLSRIIHPFASDLWFSRDFNWRCSLFLSVYWSVCVSFLCSHSHLSLGVKIFIFCLFWPWFNPESIEPDESSLISRSVTGSSLFWLLSIDLHMMPRAIAL